LQRPIQAAITAAHAQNINPEDVDDFVLGLLFSPEGPFMEVLEPFVSEPLGYDRLVDVTAGGGRKPGAGRVYTDGDTLSTKINNSFAYIMDGIKPGVWLTSEKISAGLRKDLTKGGKPVNTFDELLALFSGIRLIRIDTKSDLKYYAGTLNKLRRDIDEADGFYDAKHYQQNTPSDMVKEFDTMQEEDFRIQKDMFIRIEDMKLLKVDDRTIREILENAGTDENLVDNLMRGFFTPTNYSEPRFNQKVKYVKEALEDLSEKSDKYFFFEEETFLFPRSELDAVKNEWERREFFPDGYTPDKTKYKKNKKGQTLYDMQGNPIPEDTGIIKKGIEKIKKLVNPLSDLSSQKPQAPPLPNTPMPNVATAALQKSPQTGLTRNETALLSPSEQQIARRT